MPTDSYVTDMIDRLGPPPADEGFYRVKITGNGETNWFNVSPAELAEVRAIFAAEDEDDTICLCDAVPRERQPWHLCPIHGE